MQPPKLEKRPKKHKFWNHEIEDNHYYLEENWQEIIKNPKLLPQPIQDYIAAENQYANNYLKDTKKIQDILFEEMRGRIKEDERSAEMKYGDYYYYSYFRKKNKDQGHYSLSCRKFKNMKAKEEIIFDGDLEAKEAKSKYFSSATGLSLCQKYLAVGTDKIGNEEYNLIIREIKTKKIISKGIKTSGNFVWAKKNYLFYVVLNKERRPYKIMRHSMGTDLAKDITVFEEKDPSFFVSCGLSHDDRFMYISTSQHDTDEVWFFECDQETPKPKLIKKRELDFEYSVDYHPEGNRFFILTNKDKAVDYKIMEVSVDSPGPENWKTFLEHKVGCLILGTFIVKGWLIRIVRQNFSNEVIITNLKTYEEHKVNFPNEECYSVGASPAAIDYDSKDLIRIGFSSLKTEGRVYDYSCKTRKLVLKKKQIIPSGHDGNLYEQKKILAKSEDGKVDIPITLLWKKGMLKKDGNNPCIVSHYSMYGSTSDINSFNILRLSLVDRGFVSVGVNVRGSSAGGNNYYLKAKKLQKMKTFFDLKSAFDKLIEEKYTFKGNIVITSGSAGGMSNGYLMNNYPEYFKGVCTSVGFVTILLTMLNDKLPLSKIEEEQWGAPRTSKEAFEYILKYDPYYGIKSQPYPQLYFSNSLTDPRVGFYESFKLIQKIRERKKDNHPIIMRCEIDASHAGSSSRWDYLKKDVIPEYAWILKLFNKHKA